MKKQIFTVYAKLGTIAVWHFTAISAPSKEDAIKECKDTMKKILGTVAEYQWSAISVWEHNLGVN